MTKEQLNNYTCPKCGCKEHVLMPSGNHVTARCKKCDSYIDHVQQGLPYKMYFGKHKGKELKDVPLDYLRWAVKNFDDKKVIAQIEAFLKEYK